jgi:phenylpropionate dioxygenase-like ring-hydroxylating dioxygenase large terminal subunit
MQLFNHCFSSSLFCSQIGDPAKMKAACASPRACVASFPTTVVNGLLYAWLEPGTAAEVDAAAVKPYVMPELEASTMKMWGMTEQPVDYTFWLEQGMVGLADDLSCIILAAQ